MIAIAFAIVLKEDLMSSLLGPKQLTIELFLKLCVDMWLEELILFSQESDFK